MSRNSKKTAIRFNNVRLVTPFQVRGLGSIVLNTRLVKDQGSIHQLAAALGLNVELVPEGIKLTSGNGASIESCTGHWHLVDNFDGAKIGRVEFAPCEQEGWVLQISAPSDVVMARLSAIDGAEKTMDGTALDDMISHGAFAMVQEAFNDMLGSMFGMGGMNGHDANLGEDFDVFARMRAQGVGIDFG